ATERRRRVVCQRPSRVGSAWNRAGRGGNRFGWSAREARGDDRGVTPNRACGEGIMSQAATSSTDLLAGIVGATRRIVWTRSSRVPVAEMERRALERQPTPGAFRRALTVKDRFNVIAECKRRSPSRGVLREEYDAATIARAYEAAGAAAVSVLTEPTFF